MKAKSFLVGFLIGGIAASLSTLLTTPKSGKETRLNLKKNADQFVHQLSEIQINLNELQNAITAATLDGKVSIDTFVTDIKTTIAAWKAEIRPHQLQLQKEISSIEKTIEEIEASLLK
jgi:gas vesicle protein